MNIGYALSRIASAETRCDFEITSTIISELTVSDFANTNSMPGIRSGNCSLYRTAYTYTYEEKGTSLSVYDLRKYGSFINMTIEEFLFAFQTIEYI